MELLWSKRFNAFIQARIFLLRRLANGFAFLPVLIFLLGLYYYPQLIEWLPIRFPVKIAFAVIGAWTITRGGFRNFLQQADIVYLTPIEKGMASYFRKCFYYNIILQCFFIFALLVLLSPLYFARVSASLNDFMIYIIILLILKALNILIYWQSIKIGSNTLLWLRLAINYIFIFGLLIKNALIIVSGIMLMGIFYWGMQKFKASDRIDWLRLIEHDERLDRRFYTWIGSFVDHPHVHTKVKHHKFIAKVTSILGKKSTFAYHYLYLKMFIRTDVLGIVFRILIIGLLMLSFLPENIYFIFGAYLVLLLVIGLQIYSFWHTFVNQFWASLYPITEKRRRQAFLSTSFYIMLVPALILLIPIFIKMMSAIVFTSFAVLALVIPYSFINVYVRKKIFH